MATPSGFQSLDSVLDSPASQLKSLTERARALLALQSAFRALLPAPIREQCSVGQWAHGQLTVYAANGAVATRIKQQIPTYCGKLSDQGLDVQAIHVKVLVTVEVLPPQTRKAQIPERALDQFSALSDTLEAGPLKSAIDALVKRRLG